MNTAQTQRPFKTTARRRLYQCSDCQGWTIADKNEDVCAKCLKRAERAFFAEQEMRASAWGKKHKCQNCNAPLPLERFTFCYYCVQNMEEFEGMIGMSDVSYGMELKRKNREAAQDVKEQTCTRCGETKPIEQFSLSRTRITGRDTRCKVCIKEVHGHGKKGKVA